MNRRMWYGFVAGLLLMTAVGCGPSAPATNHAAPSIKAPSNPFSGLSAASLVELKRDITATQHDTAVMVTNQSLYWQDGMTTQTPTVQAQETQYSAIYNQASVLVPTNARLVLADLSGLTAVHQRRLHYLVPVLNNVIAETRQFVATAMTPWQGPGAPPGITKVKLTAEFKAEDKVLMKDEGVLEKAEFNILEVLPH